ncbi:MAG TPA: cyanophycin synthetase, partial [bacterium]
CRGAPGRFQRLSLPHPFAVVVDYAHTPDALETVLTTARRLTRGRLAVLFGCGGERDRAKRPLMGAIATQRADVVVLTSDNPRSEDPEAILREVERGMRGGVAHQRIIDRREAIHAVLDQARPGDFVLLCGKGSETYQEIADQKRPFDDREVVREWAAAHPAG